MKPKVSLGIAMLGIFIPLIISSLLNLIIHNIIVPADANLYNDNVVAFTCVFFFFEIIRVICMGQTFFFKGNFFSVIGIIFGVLAILLYIAGNIIPRLLSFDINFSTISGSCIFIFMWLAIILYMLFTKAWIPIKIAGVIAIIPIFVSNLMTIIFYAFLSDYPYEYGGIIVTVSNICQWSKLILSFFPVILTIIWMITKTSDASKATTLPTNS